MGIFIVNTIKVPGYPPLVFDYVIGSGSYFVNCPAGRAFFCRNKRNKNALWGELVSRSRAKRKPPHTPPHADIGFIFALVCLSVIRLDFTTQYNIDAECPCGYSAYVIIFFIIKMFCNLRNFSLKD